VARKVEKRVTAAEKLEVVTNCDHLARLKFSPVLPRAFTEHGALMAANVLNSPRASAMSVYLVRAFVKMRQGLAANAAILRRCANHRGGQAAARQHSRIAGLESSFRIQGLVPSPSVPPAAAIRKAGQKTAVGCRLLQNGIMQGTDPSPFTCSLRQKVSTVRTDTGTCAGLTSISRRSLVRPFRAAGF
jgi:hypothetical protein